MRNILIANKASAENLGDQAIFLGTLKLLKTEIPELRITVAAREMAGKKILEQLGCRVIPVYPDVGSILREEASFRKILCLPRAFADFRPLRDAVRQSDAVFLVGGGYFYSYRRFMPGLSYASNVSAAHWGYKFGKPVIFLPQSYGPFYSKAAAGLFDYAVRRASVVFFRENISGEYLKKRHPGFCGKIHYAPDYAVYLTPEDLGPLADVPARPSPIIGVTVRTWEHSLCPEYWETLAGFLVWVNKQYGLRVRVIVQVSGRKKAEGDESVSRSLLQYLSMRMNAGELEFCAMKPYFELDQLCRLYRECEIVLATRLHSALLSYICGRPALVIGYQHKHQGVLKALGLERFFLGSLEELKFERFRSVFNFVWQNREAERLKIQASIESARGDIRQSFQNHIKPWVVP